MKLKYFLRGLGAGIIFGALIMLAAYMTSGSYKVSDDEIIKRAKELGMVESDKNIIVSTEDKKEDKSTEEPKSTDTKTTETTEKTTEATTEKITTEEPSTDTQTEVTTEEIISSGDSITISVRSGMGSYEVAIIMKDAGIIQDAADFDAYLNANGYSTRIEVGEYICSPDMTYEQLAEMLIKGN